jgi:hypothetical protein
MPDGGFKSITPDSDSRAVGRRAFLAGEGSVRMVECERCGALIAAGDWPWCKNGAEDHVR